MWKELTAEARKVFRKRDPSIAGFIAEVMKHEGRFFMTMSWVEQSITHKRGKVCLKGDAFYLVESSSSFERNFDSLRRREAPLNNTLAPR